MDTLVRKQSLGWILAGAGLGILGMYIMDPIVGNRRRAFMRDKTVHFERVLLHAFDRKSRDMKNRAFGALAELRNSLRSERVDDDVLVERVRSKIGRATSHPKLVKIDCRDGVVRLSGLALKSELPHIYVACRSVRGISGVANYLQGVRDEHEISVSAGVRGSSKTKAPLDESAPAPSGAMAPTI